MLVHRGNPRGLGEELCFSSGKQKLNSGPRGTFSRCFLLKVLEPHDREGAAHLRCGTQRPAVALVPAITDTENRDSVQVSLSRCMGNDYCVFCLI